MRMEFKEDSLYIPRSNMIFFATNNSIVAPVILFSLWLVLFSVLYLIELHEKPLLGNIAIFLFPCIFLIPKIYNTSLAFKLVVEYLYMHKYPCSVRIEFGKEIITQYRNEEFRCQVNTSIAEIFRYGKYIVMKEAGSVILIPCSLAKDIPQKFLPENIKELNLGWAGRLYEKAIKDVLPNR